MTARYDPDAGDEVVEAVRWYEAKQAGLGDDVKYEIDAAVALIEKRPRASLQVKVPFPGIEVRRRLVLRFPYSVVYHVRPNGEITIVAVAHQRKRPLYWLHRLTP